MSVESEILRIQHNIADAYTKVAEKGGEVPLQPNSVNLAAAVESIPSSGDLIAGDGMSKEGNTLSVTTPVRSIVTQSEFDAMTEEQKNKGLYVISDGGSGTGGGGSAGEVYSTEEAKIGTWIDGKPLYRKVITVPVFSVSASVGNTIIPDIMDNKNLISASGVLNITKSDGIITEIEIPYADTSNSFFAIQHRSTNIAIRNKWWESISVNSGFIIIEYTKTTDTAMQEVTT